MPEVERSAPSVEEAVESALAELGVSEQEASVEILQEPRGGFLGIAAQPAVVRVSVPEPTMNPGSTAGASEPAGRIVDGRSVSADSEAAVEQDDQADIAADFIEDVLERMGIDATVEIVDDEGVTYVDIWAEGDEDAIGALIGRRGATLDGLQELVRSVVQRQTGDRCHVLVDVEDYRKRRRGQVLMRAREGAQKAQRTGREQALEPMTAYERKLVHDAVGAIGGLETFSEGEEPNRRVVIRPAAGADSRGQEP